MSAAATAYERLLDALHENGSTVRANGTTATAQCPAHDDRDPSLSVRRIDGSLLMHCHGACETDDVLAALGLTRRDLYDDPAGARYDYTDRAGKVLRSVHRSPDKRFRQSGATKGCPTLYRLPAVVAAVEAWRTVYVVEGEKDVHALESLGAVATCSPMGAGKWHKVDPSPLRGAHVVVVPDRDKAGAGHAKAVVKSLARLAGSVRLALPAAGKDAADHVAAGHGLDELVPAELPADEAPPDASWDGWDDPVPLHTVTREPFPVAALPTTMRTYCEALAIATQTPPVLAAYAMFAALGTLAGGRLWLTIRPGWVEPLNVWTITVLPSASRKSPVMNAVARPLHDLDRQRAQDAAPGINEAKTQRRIAEQRARKAETTAGQGTGSADLEAEAVSLRRAADNIEVPPAPRLLAGDVTPERAATMLAEQRGRLGILTAEGGLFGTLAGRYSQGTPNLDTFLQAWSGDPIIIDRQGRAATAHAEGTGDGVTRIDRPALSLGLAVQPDVLRELAGQTAMRGRGLLGRFVWALPESTVGRRDLDPPPVPDNATQAWAEMLGRLADLPEPRADETPTLTLSPEARRVHAGFLAELEPRLHPETGDLAGIGAWAGKLAGTVARLAALLHLAEHGPKVAEVAARSMADAVCIGRCAIGHALVALAATGARRDTGPAEAVLRWLTRRAAVPEARGSLSFKIREAWQALRGQSWATDTDAVRAAVQVLDDHGYVRRAPESERKGPGRPPSDRYLVHPASIGDNGDIGRREAG